MKEAILTFNGSIGGLFLLTLFFVAVILSVRMLRFFSRSGRANALSSRMSLEQWARNLKFSSNQLTAMRSIWHAYKSGRNSQDVDPFRHLSPQDMADLLQKCSFDHIPRELRNNAELAKRQQFMQELEERGLDPVQAEVITGMKFGKIGPASES